MVLSWIVYALAVALLLTAAAAAAERLLRVTGRPIRWAWVGAMLLSVGLPAAYLASPAVGGLPTPEVVPPEWGPTALTSRLGPAAPLASDTGGGPALDVWFLRLWTGLSAGLLAWLALSAWRLRRICRRATPCPDAGGGVHRTPRLGPGVVGLRRPRILVPEWVLDLDEPHREMVLLHEREHVRRRDPILLHAGWILLALVPWLVPLWWQFRRLRVAVELDCDQRVVDRLGDARAYGLLLLHAKRHSLGLEAPLVTAGDVFLGRRVRRLMERDLRRPGSLLRVLTYAAAVLLALTAAALLPPPGAASPGPQPANRGPPIDRELFARLDGSFDRGPRALDAEEVRAQLRAHHPEELRRRDVGGTVHVVVHVDAGGRVTGGFVTVSSGHEALDRAALEVAGLIRYSPATEDGEPVPVWIVQPLRFRVEEAPVGGPLAPSGPRG